MNPLLPPCVFVPDVEAREADGRLYLYGSKDRDGDSEYCGHKYGVFSSSDLRTWTVHGISFTADRAHGGPERRLYAPDCLRVGERYLLAYCDSRKGEGIAVSSQPHGPFDQARPVVGADGDGIDPALFLDDDGTLYYFWGQFQLRGGILDPDTLTLREDTILRSLLTEADHGFHEGASIRKRNGVYYLVYADISRGSPTCLSYATATRPLGPYTKRGVLIDNADCDPSSWNNHGSLARFGDQWILFYHRSSRNSCTHRRVCAEPVRFEPDGSILEMEMTTQGLSPPLPASDWIEAWRACELKGALYSAPVTGVEALCGIRDGDIASFKYLHFQKGLKQMEVKLLPGSPACALEVRLDHPDRGPLLCEGEVSAGGEHHILPLLSNPSGRHSVWLRFYSVQDSSFSLHRFRFTT